MDSRGVGPFVNKLDSVCIGASIFFDETDLRPGLLNRCFIGEIRPDFLGLPEGGLGMWNESGEGKVDSTPSICSLSSNSSGDFKKEPAGEPLRGFLATGSASSVIPLANNFCF